MGLLYLLLPYCYAISPQTGTRIFQSSRYHISVDRIESESLAVLCKLKSKATTSSCPPCAGYFIRWSALVGLTDLVCYFVQQFVVRVVLGKIVSTGFWLFSNYQLNAQFFYSITIYMLHYNPRHVSSSTLLIFRRTNCIITASGIVALCKPAYCIFYQIKIRAMSFFSKQRKGYYYYYYYYYYYLLHLSFHSVAVVFTLVTNKDKYT